MAHPQTPPTFTAVTTGSNEYSVELNDANFNTKAWKSSRYEGSKTQTAQLNKYTVGDISIGKTTAIQKYSRNIYVGNGVVGMDSEGGEDTSLLNIPGFSYITTIKYITVNEDNTISTDTVESQPDDFNSRRGFYRSFYEDFPVKSSCKVIVNDSNIKTNLKDSYNIFFNGGQLQKLLRYTPYPVLYGTTGKIINNVGYLTGSNALKFTFAGLVNINIDPTELPHRFLENNDRLIEFEPNLTIFDQAGKGAAQGTDFALASVSATIGNGLVYGGKIDSFTGTISSTITPSLYNGDKRLFVSFVATGSDAPIHSISSGSYPGSTPLFTNDLGELSTSEIVSGSEIGVLNDGNTFFLSEKINIPQQLVSISDPTLGLGAVAQPANFISGSAILSITEDATPSLLVKLNKNSHLPDGIGDSGFIIIPNNLHPHVKRNLIHFLSKAGVSLKLDTIPALDTTFERLS